MGHTERESTAESQSMASVSTISVPLRNLNYCKLTYVKASSTTSLPFCMIQLHRRFNSLLSRLLLHTIHFMLLSSLLPALPLHCCHSGVFPCVFSHYATRCFISGRKQPHFFIIHKSTIPECKKSYLAQT